MTLKVVSEEYVRVNQVKIEKNIQSKKISTYKNSKLVIAEMVLVAVIVVMLDII